MAKAAQARQQQWQLLRRRRSRVGRALLALWPALLLAALAAARPSEASRASRGLLQESPPWYQIARALPFPFSGQGFFQYQPQPQPQPIQEDAAAATQPQSSSSQPLPVAPLPSAPPGPGDENATGQPDGAAAVPEQQQQAGGAAATAGAEGAADSGIAPPSQTPEGEGAGTRTEAQQGNSTAAADERAPDGGADAAAAPLATAAPPGDDAGAAAASAAGTSGNTTVPLKAMPFYRPDIFDRTSPAGRAGGKRAGGRPEPVTGLVTPDEPLLGNESSSMEDLVLPQGYPLETYPVETSDGWVLRLYRIPYGAKNSTKPDPNRPVVLLHHGVTLSSACFVVLDQASSMGFYLADAGFDVWMANTRGNTFSRGNRHFRSVDQSYWEFSLDELALVDLPAQMEFILNFTRKPSLALVGHSQGGSLPLMLLSAAPEWNDRLWLMMLLGPVADSLYMQAPFLARQARSGTAERLARSGVGVMLSSSFMSPGLNGCNRQPQMDWCLDFFSWMFYGPSTFISSDDFVRIKSTWPAGVSTRNLAHWGQVWASRSGLRMFDFGTNCSTVRGAQGPGHFKESCNQAVYGQDSPPYYDYSNINATAAVLGGEDDLMATEADMDRLLSRWNANMVYLKTWPKTAHMDFVWARNPIMKDTIIKLLWDYAPR